MLNGTTDALGVGARCLEFGLTKALNGAGPVFALIEQAVVGLLGGDLAKTFGSACLQQTIGDLSAGKGFPLQGCLFQGLAKEFCEDVMNAGPFSIANSINTYFNSFRDRMAQNAGKVAITFLFVVGAAVGMACLWMSILVLFGEGLIRSSLVGDIVGLIFLVTVNFIILNIPVAILLLIYLIVKIGWFIYIYKRIRFAATLLRVCVAHLKHHPGAFFLGTFLFIWNAGWCFLFACAYLEIYTPNVFSSPQLMTVSLVFLVLAFFWSFEVWKGLLGVSVAGSLGTWYYFGYEQKINVGIKGVSQSPLQLRHPILASFAHASTLSFGSVCVGSLFLAVLKVGHWFFKRAKNSKSTFVKTFVNALFGWMESILKVYDLYSFVRVGVEYEGYFEAAKKTWGLLEEQGVDALVNDDSIVSITGTTSVLGSLVVGTLAFFMSKIFYRLDWDISLLCVVVSLFFGWAELSIMGVTVEMGVVALFVVMAEDPEVLMIRHPVECKELVAALIERCAERGWQVPTEFEILNEKMALQSVSQPS
ncbi:plasma-membrane choline transporter-domain-containing protein [Chytriomyces sp. MP71]|nr:plasma-membrane choline transporter-domain-containing protein [Chytriomyces sp. MP71]